MHDLGKGVSVIMHGLGREVTVILHGLGRRYRLFCMVWERG